MEDNAMTADSPSMEEIGNYVKRNIREWVSPVIMEFTRNREIELAERFVRVEEELKSQRELMKQGFRQMEKRFEQVDKRFEQVDKRFEQVDKRFEQVDKRFEQMERRFEQNDQRFEAWDKRFSDMQSYMNKRFAANQWFISLGFTLLAVLMSVYQFIQ